MFISVMILLFYITYYKRSLLGKSNYCLVARLHSFTVYHILSLISSNCPETFSIFSIDYRKSQWKAFIPMAFRGSILVKKLVIISNSHLRFSLLIKVLHDFTIFHHNQAITIVKSVLHVMRYH